MITYHDKKEYEFNTRYGEEHQFDSKEEAIEWLTENFFNKSMQHKEDIILTFGGRYHIQIGSLHELCMCKDP